MNKAGKAIRRNGIRLKSMGCGHGNLHMVISQLRDVKSSAKAFILAQNIASKDLLKWSMNNENEAIQDTFTQLAELNSIWAEVQKEFTEHLNEFRSQFEMILEGEQHVDQARNYMATCEQREIKMKKELEKAGKKTTGYEVRQLETKLAQAERSKVLAEIDVVDRVQENEAVKMIRVKEGLLKLSESYLELAHKCHVIHEAHRDIANEIPDVQNKNIHDIKYSGSRVAKQAVAKAKDRIRRYRHHSNSFFPCAPAHKELPPPYSSTHHPDNALRSCQYDTQSPLSNSESNSSNLFHERPRSSGSHSGLFNASVNNDTSLQQSTNPFEDTRYSTVQEHDTLNETNAQWCPDYEEEFGRRLRRI